uniref:EF-hand calcium-binding domain-containing protein 4A n=1 Tax=Geotrypetes seraphini TaxID=260995 RepID=A0A6P8PJA2_GEOSA|nr:EF-hand calcium-binding domain-containing protein 4A [Geotrypetes seraphini]XP_033783954.1 EF-hand calcium-binding domain-containing protein 4A [Geotrypetes seraphini]XP_033783955.1 EF-hand calcium-binding domain-containing protein 4A [Geotrypetes seraphini]
MEEWRAALMGKAHDKEQLESPAVTEMATTTTSLLRLEENVGDAKEETLEKAQELFQLCDKEEKGFITKQDMQRLQHELPLTSEQLESVFDSLDQSNNGYLTPVEFSMGLGKFIGMGDFRCEETFESGWSDEQGQADDEEQEEERRFCAMMERLGTYQVFGDQSEVRDLWAQLHKEHPELLANFEEFLFRVSSYIQEVHDEKESVEQVLKRKETNHDREVRHLYEEMEQQIKMEKERLLYQDSMKSRGRNALLQKELKNREQELESIVAGQKQLEQQLQALNSEQVETRVQNERLRHLNKELQEQLERSKRKLESAQSHLRQLQEEANQEQEQRDRNVFRVSRNMQKEKQSLLRQLEILREMNKKLRDERDAFEAKKLLSLRARAVLAKHSANCFSCCCCHRCHIHQTESLHCHTGHLSPQHPGLSHASSGADCL